MDMDMGMDMDMDLDMVVGCAMWTSFGCCCAKAVCLATHQDRRRLACEWCVMPGFIDHDRLKSVYEIIKPVLVLLARL